MLNELEQKIRKAIPELNELGVGTVYGYDDIPYYEIVFKNETEICFIDIVHYNKIKTLSIQGFNSLDISIIGKPIQLNHVLEYVYMYTDYVLFGDKLFFSIKDFQEFKNYIVINLKSNLLSDQSETLIKFVNELKND